MKHSKKQRTLGRTRRQRKALLNGLAIALIENGQIKTSLAKAKELRPNIEHLITFAKNDTVHSRRLVSSRLGVPKPVVLNKLFKEIAPKFKERNGGYVRIVKLGYTSPGREEAVISFVE